MLSMRGSSEDRRKLRAGQQLKQAPPVITTLTILLMQNLEKLGPPVSRSKPLTLHNNSVIDFQTTKRTPLHVLYSDVLSKLKMSRLKMLNLINQ